MKKPYLCLATLGIVLSLSACQTTKLPEVKTSSSSTQQTETSSEKSSSSTVVSSSATSSTEAVASSSSPSSSTEVSTAPEQAGMAIEEILAGDYSSIEGTWVRGDGQTFVFNADGLVSDQLKIFNVRQTGDFLTMAVGPEQGAGGFGIILVPAGVSLTREEGPYPAVTDQSDISQERLIAGQQMPPVVGTADFYYRTAN